jgi:hypothetical protein
VALWLAVAAGACRPVAAVDRAQSATSGAPALAYWGGRVISNAEVIAVNWGPTFDKTLDGQLAAFYGAITNSDWIDVLAEYSTVGQSGQDGKAGSGQAIGRATFAGVVTIAPGVQPDPATNQLTDAQVAAELRAQIAAGALPSPTSDGQGNVNTIYMINFPRVDAPIIELPVGNGTNLESCVEFTAYHYTTLVGAESVPYSVYADGCSPGGFDFAAGALSHELAEAITDMEVGLVAPGAAAQRPDGWSTGAGDEIADLCVGQPGGRVGGFAVAALWSNVAGACVVRPTAPVSDGSAPGAGDLSQPGAGDLSRPRADDGGAPDLAHDAGGETDPRAPTPLRPAAARGCSFSPAAAPPTGAGVAMIGLVLLGYVRRGRARR